MSRILLVLFFSLFIFSAILAPQIPAQQKGEQTPYFVITLLYNTQQTPTLSIKNISIDYGSIALPDEKNGQYALRLLNEDTEIYRMPFTIPNQIEVAPPEPGSTDQGGLVTLREIEFIETMPFIEGATTIDILNNTTILDTYTLDEQFTISTSRGKRQATGDNITTSSLSESSPLLPSHYSMIDIAVIGNDYSSDQLPLFKLDAEKMINHFLTYEPIRSNSSTFVFHPIDNTTDLGCSRHPNIDRCIICDYRKVQETVSTADIPYDFAVIIVNDPKYGGCAQGDIATAYNGYWGPQIFVHEFGHTFGNLRDEYTHGTDGPITNTESSNCYAGTPPSSLWESLLPGRINYHQECLHTNWYRSSQTSIMHTVESQYFNDLSQILLRDRINYFAQTRPYDVTYDGKLTSEDFHILLTLYNMKMMGYFFDYNSDGMINTIDYSFYVTRVSGL